MFTFSTIKDYQNNLLHSKTTCLEAVQYYLEAIKAKSHLNAYLEVFEDDAIATAKALDTTSNPGIAVEALLQYNTFLAKDSVKNKTTIVGNYYYIMIYYADKVKDYAKSIEYCDRILMIIPGDAEMTNIRKTLEARLNKSTQPAKPATGAKSATPAPAGNPK